MSPHVLVIGGFLPTDENASGRTLRNLLSSWAPEEVTYLTIGRPGGISNDGQVIDLLGLLRSRRSGTQKGGGGQTNGRTRQFALSLVESSRAILKPATIQYLTERKPEIIYTWLGSNEVHRLVEEVSTLFSLPVVVHIMDDWINCKYASLTIFGSVQRMLLNNSFRDLIQRASGHLAISDEMAGEYSRCFGRPFTVLSNGVDLSVLRPMPETTFERRYRLMHVGRISYERLTSLKILVSALELLRESGYVAELLIVNAENEGAAKELSADRKWVFSRACPEDSDLAASAAGFDACVLAESYRPIENDWFRLSLTAKLPVYLALGKPIIGIGNPMLPSLRFITRNECGLVAMYPTPQCVADVLLSLLNKNNCSAFASRARSLAEAEFDKKMTSGKLKAYLKKRALHATGKRTRIA